MRSGLRVEAIVFGTCLIAVGIGWTLANMGRIDLLFTLRRYWPAVLIFWGVLELVNVALVRSARGS